MDVPAVTDVLGPLRPTGSNCSWEFFFITSWAHFSGISMDLPSDTNERLYGLLLDKTGPDAVA